MEQAIKFLRSREVEYLIHFTPISNLEMIKE